MIAYNFHVLIVKWDTCKIIRRMCVNSPHDYKSSIIDQVSERTWDYCDMQRSSLQLRIMLNGLRRIFKFLSPDTAVNLPYLYK